MRRLPRGFTLVEAVMVIVITGIIAAMVAVFIRKPVDGYFDTARRAELTDVADTALRRIVRDLHVALPNSVRVSANGFAIEFLQTRTGGRYRAAVSGGGSGDPLEFTGAADSNGSFDVIGSGIAMAEGDWIVIYNLGIPGADAYLGANDATHNRRAYSGAAGSGKTNISITPATRFPFDSPEHRFYVVDTPVTYICDSGNLWRYWGYSIQDLQTKTDSVAELDALIDTGNPAITARTRALMAQNVTACTFSYQANVINERNGQVSLRLAMTQPQANETISLYQEVHVSNAP